MSLTALALRICVIEALKGRTLAGDLVFDGAGLVPEDDVPRLAIVVDTAAQEGRVVTTSLTLSLWMRLNVDAGDGNPPIVVWDMPGASPATEALLDVAAHQIISALEGDDWGWSKVWRDMRGGDSKLAIRSLPQPGSASRVLALDAEFGAAPRDLGKANGGWGGFRDELHAAVVGNAKHLLPYKVAIDATAAASGGDMGDVCGSLGLVCVPRPSESSQLPVVDVKPAVRNGKGRRK